MKEILYPFTTFSFSLRQTFQDESDAEIGGRQGQ